MPPLSIMIKPASSLCNMRCRYCFYNDVACLRDEYSFGIMKPDTADLIIKKALDFANGEQISFAFQGGEPLIAGLDFFRHFTAKVKECNKKKSEICYGIQTNGTLINAEWSKFLHDNRFLVGLSVDGNFKNNRFRVDKSGINVHRKIISAAKMLRKFKVEFNILTVLTGSCADNITEIYEYFKSMNFSYLQFIPCIRPFGDDSESELYMTDEQYEHFLITLFGLYERDYRNGNYVSIRMFDNLVQMYRGNKPEQCGMCGHCTHQFVVEGNGNVYPCDFYCVDELKLGNIAKNGFREMSESDISVNFIKESFSIPEKCKICKYFGLCRAGGCKRSREDRDYCKAYKSFFDKCLPMFASFRI